MLRTGNLVIAKQPLGRTRLDKYLQKSLQLKRQHVHLLLAKGLVLVNEHVEVNANCIVDKFSHIEAEGVCLQNNQAVYIMLNKPKGVVSATTDPEHKTVIDLITHEKRDELHLVGRLDLHSSGLVLLTNDSRWSEALTSPECKVAKKYQVTLKNPLNKEYAPAFLNGMYFDFENITTLPAPLKVLSAHLAEVTLYEGRYHQIKRMFGRFRNPVLELHRESIGEIVLDERLAPSEFRTLTTDEIHSVNFIR